MRSTPSPPGLHLKTGRYLGRRIAARSVNGLSLIEMRYPAGARLRLHAHEHAHLCLVLDGGYRETIGRESTFRPSGALLFLPADTSHAEVHETAGRHFLVELTPRPGPLDDCLHRLRTPVEISGVTAALLVRRLFREFHEQDDASALAIEGLTLELLAAADRSRPRKAQAAPRWLEEARALIHARFREPLGLGAVAVAVGVHPGHLAQQFRRHFRCSLGEYLRAVRVHHAEQRLAKADAGLSEIALDSGFADQSHFTRAFRRLMGITPGAFRRARRGL